MLSLVCLSHIIAHSVTSVTGEGSKHFLFKWFLWEWKAMWVRNPENEEELQQGSHARLRDLEMMKQKPTLEQRALQIFQVPSLSKPIQQATNPPPPLTFSHFMPSHSFSFPQRGEVWNQINSLPHLPASWTPSFPQNISSESLGDASSRISAFACL